MKIEPMTDERWNKLSKKEQWDIKVVLRGPDHTNTLLKLFTTAVIRAVVQPVMRVGGMVNYRAPALILPEIRWNMTTGAKRKWGFDLRHFLSHIDEAAGILNIPKVSIPNSEWEECFQNGIDIDIFYERLLASLRNKAVTKGIQSESALLKRYQGMTTYVEGLYHEHLDDLRAQEEDQESEE
jgi:hypothetical protein